MRVLVVHNSYQQPGGEDVVVERETTLLERAGHEVLNYRRSNAEIHGEGLRHQVRLAGRVVWARDTLRALGEVIRRYRPDIAHVHNTFFMISPSIYAACNAADVPVVQSLHNPRLLCPAASFYRDGRICVDCLGKTPPWPGVLHACYRGSRHQTAAVAAMLTVNRWLGTWQRRVDAYIAFTEFYRQKFIEGGLPEEKLFVKPHFVDPDPGPPTAGAGGYVLFVGRLDPEKGVRTLLRAWQQLREIPLRVRGNGRLRGDVESVTTPLTDPLTREALGGLYKDARFLVWPSEGYYETFGLVAIEAFAYGIPVIASRVGVMAELVREGVTGLQFAAGDSADLAAKVRWAWEHPDEMMTMGRNARVEYEIKYTASQNLQQLLRIYEAAMARRGTAAPVQSS